MTYSFIKKAPLIIIVLTFVIGIYFYPRLPDLIASHWSADGRVNGYLPKASGLFLMPLISAVLYLVFRFLPQTDPYKHNFKQFEKYYDSFILVVILFLFYIYSLTITWNTGWHFNLMRMLSPAFSLLFYFMSSLIAVAKRNWFVGIRTPWTLSSDFVWNETHEFAARLYRLIAFIALFGFIFPSHALWFILVPLIAVSFFVFIYSYLIYRRHLTEASVK